MCVVSPGAFLVRYVARVMSAEVHETAEISPLPSEEWIHTRPERRTGPYMHAEMHAEMHALSRACLPSAYARRMTVNLPHLVHQSVSHHY